MHRSPFAPPFSEDELADEAVARGRNAGGAWIIASVVAFGIGLGARSAGQTFGFWLVGLVLFAIGMIVRARYWRSVRRRLGDATIQRARWRTVDAEPHGKEQIVWAVALVLLLIGVELWTK